MIQIRPGLYREADGRLCLYMTAFLLHSGLPITPETARELRCRLLIFVELLEGKTVTEVMD
jgi:hypothetical protein